MRLLVLTLVVIPIFTWAQNNLGLEVRTNRFDVYSQVFFEHELKENQSITMALGCGTRATFAARTVHPSLNLRYNYTYFQGERIRAIIGANTFSSLLPVGKKNSTFYNEIGTHTGVAIGGSLLYHVNIGCSVGAESSPGGTQAYFNAHLNMGLSYAF